MRNVALEVQATWSLSPLYSFFGCPAMSLYPSLALVAVFLYLNRFLQGKTGRRTEKIGRGGGAVAFALLPTGPTADVSWWGDVPEF